MAKGNGKAKIGMEAIESMTNMPTDAMKKTFERAMSFGGDFTELNRASMQAFTESAKAAGKGFEAMNSLAFTFMKQSMENGMEATKAMTGVKSIGEVTEMQAGYAKSAFQAYIEQMNEMSSLFATTMRETVEPLNAQAGAVVEKFQGAA